MFVRKLALLGVAIAVLSRSRRWRKSNMVPAPAIPKSRSARPSPIAGRPRPMACSARPKPPISNG